MSILECKNCGAPLPEAGADGTATCKYCGLMQSVPMTDMRTANLYQKANNQRRFQQYDEAMETYKSILKLDPESAEAYWGLCLCRYGVEFVTDPPTGKVMATINRMHLEPFTSDTDYKEALAHAGLFVQDHYREVGSYLSSVQKNYFLLKEKEKPYDIFICFKDSNEDGTRTRDSIHAEVLYEELTAEGYRVFFSRRTLYEVSGQQYEGHIYMALSNARVMLLVSSRLEYVETPWMKNEWSRYLYQISQDPGKKLMLLYRDLDPAGLPSKLSRLQGLDMKRWDFLDTLKERLKAVFAVKKEAVKEEGSSDDEYQEILKSAAGAMNAGKYEKAAKDYEKALDYAPESSENYWNLYLAKGGGMCHLNLADGVPLELKLAFRFADEKEKEAYVKRISPTAAEACFQEWRRLYGQDAWESADSVEKMRTYLQKALEMAEPKKTAAYKEEARDFLNNWEKKAADYKAKREEARRRRKERDEKERQRDKRGRELEDAKEKIRKAHNSRMSSLEKVYDGQKQALLKDTVVKRRGKQRPKGYYYVFPVMRQILFALIMAAYCLIQTMVLPRLEETGNSIACTAVQLSAPAAVLLVWALFVWNSYLIRKDEKKDDYRQVLLAPFLIFAPTVILMIGAAGTFAGASDRLYESGMKAFALIPLFVLLIDWFLMVEKCGEMKERLYSYEKMGRQIEDTLEKTRKAWEAEFNRITGMYPGLKKVSMTPLNGLAFEEETFEKLPGIFSEARGYALRLKIKEFIGILCCIAVCAGMWVL